MKQLFKKIHLWMALPLGLVMSVVCITGAILVLERPVTEALYPDFYTESTAKEADVQPQESHIAMPDTTVTTEEYQCTGDCANCKTGCPPADTQDTVDTTNGQDTTLIASDISVSGTDDNINSGGTEEDKDAKGAKEANRRQTESYQACLNSRGAKEEERQANAGKPKKLPFFESVLRLHRWLLDKPAKRGDITVGNVIVEVSVIMFVIDLLTGLVIWWPRTRKMLHNRLTVKTRKGWRRLVYDSHVSLGFWSMLLLLIIALTGLTWSFSVWRDVVATFLQTMVDESEVRKTIFSLHTGTWAGGISQTIYFIVCIIGAALPLTGYYMWWKRKKN